MLLRACFVLLVSTASAAFAAVPVEERNDRRSTAQPAIQPASAAPAERSVYRTQETAAPAAASSGLVELFNELQLLRGEVQELRGEVERQSYRLKQLENRQDEQYRDVDRRLAALATQPAPAAPAPSSGATSSGGSPAITTRSTAGVAANIPDNEEDAYAAAFEAMKARQFDTSIQQFGVFVQTYPNGDLTPNAFYWLGELHLANSSTEDARQSFAQLINLYPDHQKVPDALYKMGVVYHRLGDNSRALEYLGRVRENHPNTSAAGLAATYAAELE